MTIMIIMIIMIIIIIMVIMVIMTITMIILDSLTINRFFSLRKKKEHADTPPSEAEHMVCEVRTNFFMMIMIIIMILMTVTDYHDDYDDLQVIGHPCCIGIRGQCQITTKEFCDFVQGVFHDEAALCSQVLLMLTS